MELQQFWRKYYPESGSKEKISIASNNGHPYLWMRKTDKWIYLADGNGDFRAAKGHDNLFKVITEWLNGIKAGQEKLHDFQHAIIKENIAYNAVKGCWTYNS